jgi:hypothetical protein
MSALALAAATSAPPDWIARWLGVAGLVASVISVIVTVTLWRRDGWRLSVVLIPASERRNNAEAGWGYEYGAPSQWEQRPAQVGYHGENDRIFRVKVINTGRMSCVVSDVALWGANVFPVRWGSRLYSEVKLDHGDLPRTLEPTEAVIVTLTGNAKMNANQYRVGAAVGRHQFFTGWTW